MSEDILFSKQGHLGIITLNRPAALNALTRPMIHMINEQLTRWLDDVAVAAVVIQSSNEKAFCAGGDVRWLYESRKQGISMQMTFFEEEYRLNRLIHHYPKPYIALMDGITMGGGVGIALHGSHPVASTRFVFAMPETSIGFFPDIGASYLLSQCPGKLGIYLGLTGNRLPANEAYLAGLVKHVVNASSFEAIIQALMKADLSMRPDAVVSEILAQFNEPVEQDALDELQKKVDDAFQTIDVLSMVKRLSASNDDWDKALLSVLEKKAPMSLCVTLSQLIKAKHLNFDECMDMDQVLVRHFMLGHDFYEGVRALLIDKDKSPEWSPLKLTEVTSSMVETYFLP